MKAPDKIYLAESNNVKGEISSNFASSTPFRIHDSIAYLRKDALLEWAKETQRQMRIEAGGCYNTLAAGKFIAYKEIFDKIESL